ncbi:MAG: hypothetical protein HY916_09140 [Desulfovibrio sp.]|jgi:hypothetical protein|nr:hypothetical protein [Desulfovibrio sp.]
MATTPNDKPAAIEAAKAATEAAEAAKTDERIAMLEKKLQEANAGLDAMGDLQRQFQELQEKIKDMQSISAGSDIAAAVAEDLKAEAEVMAHVINDKRVKIRIASGEGEAEKKPVPVLVNGHMVFIPRDKDSVVPKCAYEALINATYTTWETDASGRPGEPREVPRYNVTFLGDAADGE